jgi:hypothetical protein
MTGRSNSDANSDFYHSLFLTCHRLFSFQIGPTAKKLWDIPDQEEAAQKQNEKGIFSGTNPWMPREDAWSAASGKQIDSILEMIPFRIPFSLQF